MTGKRIVICILVIFSLFSCNGLISDSRPGTGEMEKLKSLIPVSARYVYLINETIFSENDLSVIAVSPDGTMWEIPRGDYSVFPNFGGPFVETGLKPITVTYTGKTASYIVTVTDDANAIDLPPGGDTGVGVGIVITWGD
jgi:hypothetical protein